MGNNDLSRTVWLSFKCGNTMNAETVGYFLPAKYCKFQI